MLEKFLNVAKEYGLELEESLNFHEFYERKLETREHHDLFKKIGFATAKSERLMDDP